MAMRYADEATVLAQLHLSTEVPEDEAAITRVRNLEAQLCLTFDEKTGTSFGETPAPETRAFGIGSFTASPPSFGALMPIDYSLPERTPRLITPVAVRSVNAIEEGGEWDGSGWDDATVLTSTEYLLVHQTPQGFYGIDRLGGSWGGHVRVTGVWSDQPTLDVPIDITGAMNFIVSETYRMQHASPADEIGPDGMMVRPRNPWKYEQVVEAINRHRIVRVLI